MSAQAQIITTFAGNGTPGFMGDGGQATAAELSSAQWVATDAAGNVYISDLITRRIRKVNAAGIITTFAGNGGCCFGGNGGLATAATIWALGVAIDDIGNVYFSNADYTIRKVDTSGIITNIAGDSTIEGFGGDGGQATAALLDYPSGITIDATGNIYFCDQENFRVRKINTAGIINTIAGNGSCCYIDNGDPATASGLLAPVGIAVDGYGSLYFIGNHLVLLVNTVGIINTVAGGGPTGYVGDGGPATASGLPGDFGVAVDGCGNFYFSSGGNINEVNTTGILTVIAGNGGTGYSGDGGPATAATVDPYGIAVDAYGNVYSAESTRVRKIGTGNHAPFFTGGDSLAVCENSGANSINALLAAMDLDTLQKETWRVLAGPVHGTVAAAYTTISTGDTLTPTGLYYTPATGYTGNDSFKVIVTDCMLGADTTTVHVAIVTGVSAITGPNTLCMGATATLGESTVSGTWSSAATAIASLGSATGVVSGLSGGTAVITYSIGGGCLTSKTITVNVTPPAITGTTILCPGTTTTLSDSIGGGAWSSSNTAIGTIATGGIAVAGIAAGTATISYTLGTGCATATTVTVNPLPPAITGTMSVCAGATTMLGNSTTGGVWSSPGLTVGIGTATGMVTGVSPGTAIITYTLPTGCIATAIVTVNALPLAITGTAIMCGGATTTLGEAATGGTWSSSNLSVASVNITSGVVTGGSVSAISTTTITYTTIGNCVTSIVVTVNPQPAPITGASSLCAGATILLTCGPGGGSWSSSNTAIAIVSAGAGGAGVVMGVLAGTATIIYTLPTGCNSSTVITILSSPSAIAGILSTCIGATTTLSDTITGGYWTSSNTSVATIDPILGIVTGAATGTATISYTLGTGCAIGAIVTINNAPLPISGTLTLCPGSSTGLSDAISGGAWISSSTSVATADASGNVYGVSAGTAIISYTLGTCTVTAIGTVNATPPAISGVTEVCVGLATLLTDATTGGTWSSGNAAIASIVGATGILTGGGAGTATISYTLPDGCAATRTETVNTTPPVITGVMEVCPGTVTTLIDAGGGSWSSGNTAVATVGSTGIVGGVTMGTASIAYSIGAGCSISATVTVNPLPAAISGTEVLCAGSTTALSDGAGTWSSSNTAIATTGSASGIVSGVAGGTAIVTYTSAATGCTAHAAITINPLPLTITGTLSLCSGATAMLSDHTTGGVWSSSATTTATIGSTGTVTGLAPGTSVITYSNPATGCSTHTTLTVNPLPLIITGTLSVCAGASTTLLDATSGGVWSAAPGSTAIMSGGAGAVSGVSAGTAVVSYTLPTGCASSTIVTVNPLPAITGPTAECVGATIGESVGSTGSLSTGSLSTGSLSTGSLSTGGAWSSSITTVATVGSVGNVTGVTTGTTVITYTSAAGCKATTTITVSLSPTGIIGALSVCAGDTTTLSDAVGGGVWSSSNSGAATVGSLNGTVMGVAVGTTTITYSLGSTGSLSTGCTVTKILTVNTAPDGITGITSVCIGATTLLADATTGGVWSSGASGIATVMGSGLLTGGTEGIDTITYTHGGCSVNTTVTVNLTPLAIMGMGSVCAGDSTALSDGVSGGVWTSPDLTVGIGTATGIVTGVSPGTATITYSLGAGCAVTKIITVNPISAITGSMGMCLGTTTALSDATSGGTWSSGATAIASVNTTGIVTGALTGTSVITYTTAAGCTATAMVTVNLVPSAISGTLHVCAGSATTLGNTAGGGVWTSSNTAAAVVSAGAVVTGIAPGTTVITYSLGSTGSLLPGCTVMAVVTVDAVPLGITGVMSMCAGATTMLTESSTGGTWSSGSGGIATVTGTGMVTAVSAGTVVVSYASSTGSLSTGCVATVTVTVNPLPALIAGTTHLCAGLTTTLTSATTGGSWSSPDLTVGIGTATGIVTGVSPGPAIITYALPSGCSTSTTITINAAPAAITGGMAVCEGSGTALTDLSAGGLWSSPDLTVGIGTATGIVTGIALGTATISYTVGGCAATVVVTVNSLPEPVSSTSLCVGSTEMLTDLPDGGTWSSPDLTVGIGTATGIITGLSPGTATIAYSLGVGCTVMGTVTVDALPGAITGTPEVCVGYTTTLTDAAGGGVWSSPDLTVGISTATGIVTGVSGGAATISYTSTSTGCAATRLVTVVAVPAISGVSDMCAFSGVATVTDAITGGTWTSTSVTVSTAGVVTPHSAGAASLTYTIPLGCYVTASFSVNPLPGPVTGDFRFCRGSMVTLGDTTAGGVWSSSNAAVAEVSAGAGAVTGLSGGAAIISYVMPTGCMETEMITVDSFPEAGTITGLTSVCVGATTILADLSAGGSWSSSNTFAGVLSGVTSGVSAGVDTIRYMVSNSCGSASTAASITVNPLPEAGAITGLASVCIHDSITLTDAVAGGVWSSPDLTVGIGTATGTVYGVSGGIDTIKYSVTNSCGTVASAKVVTVNTLPNPGSISSTDTLCAGGTYTLTDSVSGGVWSSSNSSLSITAGGIIGGVSVGVDTIVYSVANMCGTAVANAIIAVKAMGGADSISGLTYVCEGGTDTIIGTPQGGVWSSSNANVTVAVTATGAIITGMTQGVDTIIYTMPGECVAAPSMFPVTVLSVKQCDEAASPGLSKGEEVLRIWPNPNDGAFMVLLSSGIDEEVEILITNVVGEQVREVSTVTNRTTEIKLNAAEGVYFISASTSAGSYEGKVAVGE